jgi:tetratricopeptide (TPR) repeat protein
MKREENIIAAGVAAIFAAVLLVYWPALHGGFIWDDLLNIDRNPLIRSDSGLWKIWLGKGNAYDYYPLTWTTWWLEWRAWGREVTGYHVVNFLLHAATAAMLWRVLVRLEVPGALVAALVFALHPVNVESVAWISERKNTLSMFLAATSVALYLDARKRRERVMYWGAVGVFMLALLAKPSVVMLPATLLILAWWKQGSITRSDLRGVAPMFIIAVLAAVVTVWFHHARGIRGVEVRSDGPLGRLAGAGMAVCFYLQKLVAPVNLSFAYPRWQIHPSELRVWLPLAGLIVVSVVLLLGQRFWGRGPAAALACFVVMLAPVLGFIDVYFMRFSFVADHWQYPACIAPIAFAVGAVAHLLRRIPRPPVRTALGGVIAFGVCASLAALARSQAGLYESSAALWADAVAKSPDSWLAVTNHASELASAGRIDDARWQFLRAIEINPDARETYTLMGEMYERSNQLDEAAHWYRAGIGRSGGAPDPRIRLAGVLAAQGQSENAIYWFEQSLAADADEGVAHAPLAVLYEAAGRKADALEQFRASAVRWPDVAEDRFAYGLALLRAGNAADANRELAEARRLSGDDHVAVNSLGVRLLFAEYHAQAAEYFREVIRLRPDYAQGHNNLGKALRGMGRIEEAIQEFDQALQAQPGFEQAQLNRNAATTQRSQTQPASSP